MIQKLYHITVFFPHIIKNQQPFRNAETHAKVVVFQGSQVIFHPLRSPSIGFFQAWRLAPFYPDHFNPHLNTFGNTTITLTLLRLGGGVKFTWPTQNFNFQWETALQTPQKPPDFLYFDLTDPMVPNLADVFILVWISGTDSRGAYQAKMAIFSYFDIFAQVSNLSYILPSECYASKSSRKC